MSDGTRIDYCDATWPVVAGCTRVSEGCEHCYAVRSSWRLMSNPNPAVRTVYDGTVERRGDRLDWTGIVRCLPERLDWPLRWRKARRIFVCNMADLFHVAVPDMFIRRIFAIIAACPQHTFLVLTKRPERMAKVLSGNWSIADFQWLRDMYPWLHPSEAWPLPNVWVGVTVENQEQAARRIPLLLHVPAAVRWVSIEPLLGPVRLAGYLRTRQIHWVVVGGETGPGARPLHPDWVRSIRDECIAASVPLWFKSRGDARARPSTGSVDRRTSWRSNSVVGGSQP